MQMPERGLAAQAVKCFQPGLAPHGCLMCKALPAGQGCLSQLGSCTWGWPHTRPPLHKTQLSIKPCRLHTLLHFPSVSGFGHSVNTGPRFHSNLVHWQLRSLIGGGLLLSVCQS